MLIPLCPDCSSVDTPRHIFHHVKAALLECLLVGLLSRITQKLLDEVDEILNVPRWNLLNFVTD